ncbi:MAG: response regulator, partial [Chloroflexi bacterium]|nr:response regulator [Chloroflexota bacterium]
MSSEKIIIVDDEVDVLDLCKRILESKGYQVTTAPDGHEVVEFAKREHFDLLLT